MNAPARPGYQDLTPARVLDALDAVGLRPDGRLLQLNSYENRVHQAFLEDGRAVVTKFYRPGRWSREQILEEHEYLAEADAAEIPVCPARPFRDGSTVAEIEGIFYTLFDRKGGRAPDELGSAAAERLGMLVARLHLVGTAHPARHRLRLTSADYLRPDLDWLEETRAIPPRLAKRWQAAAGAIADAWDRASAGREGDWIRLHGDLHLGNVLERDGVLRLLDFDDMMVGPPVQDLWLALGGRDAETLRGREVFLEAYESFRPFDRTTLAWIEPLRGLRMAHYTAWLARRWHDPIFPPNFPYFGAEDFWERDTADLEEQAALVLRLERAGPGATAASAAPEEELSNKDLFWDWEG